MNINWIPLGAYKKNAAESVADQDSWKPVRIQHFKWIRIRIQGFDDQKLKKYSWNKIIFSWSNLLIPRPSKRMSIGPSYGEAFSPQKRTSNTFFYFCGSFLPYWIRIQSGSGFAKLSCRNKPVLKPDLDLSFWKVQHGSHLYSPKNTEKLIFTLFWDRYCILCIQQIYSY